jgi:hypothetical protein
MLWDNLTVNQNNPLENTMTLLEALCTSDEPVLNTTPPASTAAADSGTVADLGP